MKSLDDSMPPGSAKSGEPTILEVTDVTHRFGAIAALDGVSMTAERGEFLTLLGESGSGKTTLLRIIAGLETPTAVRRIAIAGEDVTGTPAAERNCTTVFQHYALFPHMSVGENIEYGLRVRRTTMAERRARTEQALELVRLPGMYDRRIHQLSGGERQRVALARAIVTEPTLLLLDEPLGALDEKLRLEMQVELLELHQRLGLTFVYVTHSQEEALTMSDRILLMRSGRIIQEGPPTDLFERPATRFVAEFMGVENIVEGELAGVTNAVAVVRVGDHEFRGQWCGTEATATGSPVCLAVRAERVRLLSDEHRGSDDKPNSLDCRAGSTIYKGKYIDQTLETEIGAIRARIWDQELVVSDVAHIWWRPKDCAVIPIHRS